MLKAINNGHLLALASDQNAGTKGVPIKFFNSFLHVYRRVNFFYTVGFLIFRLLRINGIRDNKKY